MNMTLLPNRQERGQPDGAAAGRDQDAEARRTARPRLDLGPRGRGRPHKAEGFSLIKLIAYCGLALP